MKLTKIVAVLVVLAFAAWLGFHDRHEHGAEVNSAKH